MKYFGLVILLISLSSCSSAPKKTNSDDKPVSDASSNQITQVPRVIYFYEYAQTGTDSGEWTFLIPECAKISEQKYRNLKKCFREHSHEVCETNERTLAENSSGDKQKFPKALVLFTSKKDCEKGRIETLSQD